MRLKLDENLGKTASRLLRQAGHDMSSVPEQGLASASDRDIIEVCRRERRCLVSLDLDFSNPLIFSPSDYSGIAVLRLGRRPDQARLHEALKTLSDALNRFEIQGKLWIVQPDRIREFQPKDEDSGV